MVSLIYVGAYIVADRYIRRYMHLSSNLPTFARPPIYRTKIVSSSKKSHDCHDCHEVAIRRIRERERISRLLYYYFMRKFEIKNRILAPSKFIFWCFFQNRINRHDRFPTDIPVSTRINSRVLMSRLLM